MGKSLNEEGRILALQGIVINCKMETLYFWATIVRRPWLSYFHCCFWGNQPGMVGNRSDDEGRILLQQEFW